MNTLTPQEKDNKRARRFRKLRKVLIRQMDKDVTTLRKIIRGLKKPE